MASADTRPGGAPWAYLLALAGVTLATAVVAGANERPWSPPAQPCSD